MILGEYRRTLDDRFRLTIPSELLPDQAASGGDWQLVKERPGCLSLWRGTEWREHLDASVRVVASKHVAGRLRHRVHDLQALGRLLSTRDRTVQLAGRGRLLIPEGFREFLAVEAGSDLMVVGAAVCIELWSLPAWTACLAEEIPRFGEMLEDLAG